MANQYNIVIVYKNSDGSLRVTYLAESDRLPGESDTVFAERIKQRHGASTPELLTLPSKVIPYSDLPADKENKRKWRELPNGKIKTDHSVKIPAEEMKKHRDAARGKLKLNGLTDEEIDSIMGVG